MASSRDLMDKQADPVRTRPPPVFDTGQRPRRRFSHADLLQLVVRGNSSHLAAKVCDSRWLSGPVGVYPPQDFTEVSRDKRDIFYSFGRGCLQNGSRFPTFRFTN